MRTAVLMTCIYPMAYWWHWWQKCMSFSDWVGFSGHSGNWLFCFPISLCGWNWLIKHGELSVIIGMALQWTPIQFTGLSARHDS